MNPRNKLRAKSLYLTLCLTGWYPPLPSVATPPLYLFCVPRPQELKNSQLAPLNLPIQTKHAVNVSMQSITTIRKTGFSNKLNSAPVSHQPRPVLLGLNISCLRQNFYFPKSLKTLMISLPLWHKEIHCHPTSDSTLLIFPLLTLTAKGLQSSSLEITLNEPCQPVVHSC